MDESDLAMTISDGMIRAELRTLEQSEKAKRKCANCLYCTCDGNVRDDLHRPEDTTVEYLCHRRDGHEFETAHSNRCNYWKKRIDG